jgi:glycosyltransferase involved in cell wall biosynthesis
MSPPPENSENRNNGILSNCGIKLLYVCPMAHTGYHPRSRLVRETAALQKAGLEISLCTFCGVPDETISTDIIHKIVASNGLGRLLLILKKLEKTGYWGNYFAGFIEKFSTLCFALRLKRKLKFDVIYLRDGDSLIFEQVILGLFTRNYRWAISIIAKNTIIPPNKWQKRFINARFWKPIYRRAFAKNKYLFFCENEYLKSLIENEHVQGILSGRVRKLSSPTIGVIKQYPKTQARIKLGLPVDGTLFLHFGSLHPGKDIETVFAAMKDIREATLVYVGYVEPWIKLHTLLNRHQLTNKAILNEQYVSEDIKEAYFAAADAIILSYRKDFLQNASMLWEAAASKLPVIASDGGEMAKLVEQYRIGHVFQAEKPDSLRDELKKFLDLSEQDKNEMSCNFEEFCKYYSESKWTSECIEMIKELTKYKFNIS